MFSSLNSLVVVVFCVVSKELLHVHATTDGALDGACGANSMFPSGHRTNPQTSPSPYAVETSKDTYAAGEEITVTLKGSESFKGFMILALKENDETGTPVGSFEVQGASNLAKTLCSGAGLTHTRPFATGTPTDTLTLKWKAPDVLAGNIIFYVTFVKRMDTFWVKVASPVIQPTTVAETTATPTTTTTEATKGTADPALTTTEKKKTDNTEDKTDNTEDKTGDKQDKTMDKDSKDKENSGTRHHGMLLALRDMALSWLYCVLWH